jgi:parallel beta-helix repeat protein
MGATPQAAGDRSVGTRASPDTPPHPKNDPGSTNSSGKEELVRERRSDAISLTIPLVLATALLAALPSAASATEGNVVITSNWTLTEDHYGSIRIDANDVTLDCAGHTVHGPGDFGLSGGISFHSVSGVIVKNCMVTGFAQRNGIYCYQCNNARIENNTLVQNGAHGMHISGVGVTVVGNTSRDQNGPDDGMGIVGTELRDSRIEGNQVTNNRWAGIGLLDDSQGNVVFDNIARGNGFGIVLQGASKNELRGNTVEANSYQGLALLVGDGNLVWKNTITRSLIGIEMYGASGNVFRENVVNKNTYEGFKIYLGSNDNEFIANKANANGSIGFWVFDDASHNVFDGNVGHGNLDLDAYDDGTGEGNAWRCNNFGATGGIALGVWPCPPRTCVQEPPDMTAWWPADGDARDIIGGLDGLLVGDAVTGSGLVGGAFVLDGDGDFVEVPDNPALNVGTGDFSIALWAFFNARSDHQEILAEKWIQRFPDPEDPNAESSEGWTFAKMEDDHLLFANCEIGSMTGADVNSRPLPIKPGTWVHLAATRKEGVITLYMDSRPVAQGLSSLNLDAATPLLLGHRAEEEYPSFLGGRIDEVQFSNGTAWTREQISQIYQAGTAGVCKP